MANGFGPTGFGGPGPGMPANMAPAGTNMQDVAQYLQEQGMLTDQDISGIVAAAQEGRIRPEDISAQIQDAMSGIPAGVSAQDLTAATAGFLSADEINQRIADGSLSQADVEALIDANRLTRDQVQQLIAEQQFDPSQLEGGIDALEQRLAEAEAGVGSQIEQAIAGLPPGLTAEDVSGQIGQAIEGLPPGMTPEQVQEIAQGATAAGIAGLPEAFDPTGIQDQIAALQAREGFDPTGMEGRLAALEGAEGFDPTGLQDQIAALQDAEEPTFDREQLIADIMNEVYADMDFAGPTGGDMSGMGPGDPTTAVDVEQIVEDYIVNNVDTLSAEDMEAYVGANLISEERINELVEAGSLTQDEVDQWIGAATEGMLTEDEIWDAIADGSLSEADVQALIADGVLSEDQVAALVESGQFTEDQFTEWLGEADVLSEQEIWDAIADGSLSEEEVQALIADGVLSEDQIAALVESGQFTQEAIDGWITAATEGFLSEDEIWDLIESGQMTEDQVQDLIAAGQLTEDHIQALIDVGTFTEDQITTWITQATEQFQSEDEIMDLIQNFALSSDEIQSLIDQGLLTDDHIKALIQSEQLSPDEIRGLVAEGRLDPDAIRAIIAEMTGGIASGDLADYVTLLYLEDRLAGYATSDSVGTQISEALGGVDVAGLQDQYAAMQDQLATLQQQYADAQTEYEADATEQQIQQTQDNLNNFFTNAQAPNVTTGSTSVFGDAASSPMSDLAASQQSIWAPFVGNQPVTFQNMAYGQGGMQPGYGDYPDPMDYGTWGTAPVGSTSNLEYPSPFLPPGGGGNQGGLVGTPQASTLLNGKMGVDQTQQTGIMNPLAFQTNVAPFQNAFRPNRPR